MRGKKVTSTFVPCPIGVHVGRLIRIIDLGTQTVDYKQGKGPQEEEQIELIFETSDEMYTFNEDKGPEPFLLSKTVANKISTGKNVSNLCKVFEALTGETLTEDHDLDVAVDLLCQLNVVHTTNGENTYAKIESFLPLSKEQRAKADADGYERYNDQYVFDLSDFNEEVFDALTKFTKDKVAKSKEYAAVISGESVSDGPTDDQPGEEIADEVDQLPFEAPPAAQPAKTMVAGKGITRQAPKAATPAPAKAPVKTVAKPTPAPAKAPVKTVAKPTPAPAKAPVKTVAKPAAKGAVKKFK